jgi:hypothetical protein
MPSRLANLIPESPEKQTIGLRSLLAREFGSPLLIIVPALVAAKLVEMDGTKSCLCTNCVFVRQHYKETSLTCRLNHTSTFYS